MAIVNDRVSEAVSRFEAYINANAKKPVQTIQTQSHNIINANEALPIASDSQPSQSPNIIGGLIGRLEQ